MSAAWKNLELRVCRALGGRRGGPMGAAVSDCVGVPWATEIKRSKGRTSPDALVYGPTIRARWIWQAKQQSKLEGKPWLLVVAGHNDRRPVAVLDFYEFVQIAQDAGLIKRPLEVVP